MELIINNDPLPDTHYRALQDDPCHAVPLYREPFRPVAKCRSGVSVATWTFMGSLKT